MAKHQAENTQSAITQQQLDVEKQQLQESEVDRAQRIALQKPAVDFNTALTSGDRTAAMSALAPALAPVAQATKANKEAIWESQPPGAGRDVALQMNDASGRDKTASLQSNSFLSAFDKLANIGAGVGSFSLQELGAGLTAGGQASSSNQSVINAEQQRKSSQLGFLGELAGAGGAAFAGR